MGFWSTLGNALYAIGEMNNEAISDAAKLSTDELCEKVNRINALVNPLIYSACSEELSSRARKMVNDELFTYYSEYEMRERTDARDVLFQELVRRGLASDNQNE